jgi:hypothetical protein
MKCFKNAYRIASETAKRAMVSRIGSTICSSVELLLSSLLNAASPGVVLTGSLIPEETKLF